MTTGLNKKRAEHIAEMLDELEYMRRVAFNNAVLSPEDVRYKPSLSMVLSLKIKRLLKA